MKSQAFLQEANKYFSVPFDRLQKLATALRKAGLYPDGRSANEVSIEQASHLIRLLAINPNPFTSEAEKVVSDFKELITKNGDWFISDLAEIMSEGGLFLPSKKGANFVHHISISLDRNFALIAFENKTQVEGENEEATTYTVNGEKLYGDSTPRAHERFAILKKSMLWSLGILIQEVVNERNNF